MATQKAVTANAIKHNNGTILHAGNVDTTNGPIQSDLSLSETAYNEGFYGSKVNLADGSPLESGTIGTQKAISAGVFASMEEGEYVAKIIGDRVAQTDQTFLRSGAAQISSRRTLHYAKGNRRYDITSWDYETGVATKGANAGVKFTYVDPETGSAQAEEPAPTRAVPGRLTYMVNGKTPTNDTYSQRNN